MGLFKKHKDEPEQQVDRSVNRAAATAAAIERKIELDKLHDSKALSDAEYETALDELKEELAPYNEPG